MFEELKTEQSVLWERRLDVATGTGAELYGRSRVGEGIVRHREYLRALGTRR